MISIQERKQWQIALSHCGDYSVYHSPEYNILAQDQGEGAPYLFYFQNNDGSAALPILLREISPVPGLERYSSRDATSVYGYPGIVTSIKQNHPRASQFREEFQDNLRSEFLLMNVVDFFSRLNPLILTSWLFEGMGEIVSLGQTVAINLTLPEQDQIKNMTRGHRYDLRKVREAGITVREDSEFDSLAGFIRMYRETMVRTNANEYYCFSQDYFLKLKSLFGTRLRLFIAEKGGSVISASLFFMTDKVIQYHLSATPDDCLCLGGAKLILDEVRIWGRINGYHWLHLGGGVGSREDSLFRFKAGFSKTRVPFSIVKMVLQPDVYADISSNRDSWLKDHGMKIKSDYFPIYRAPIAKERE